MALRPLNILSLCAGVGTMTAEHQRRWRERNPEKARQLVREYQAANRERLLEQKRDYYQRVRKPRDKTPEGQFADREKKSRRRAAKKGERLKWGEWQAILRAHDHRCAYCGCQPATLEMDHVVPLSKGGRHHASNIVPACKPCNSAKGARCG